MKRILWAPVAFSLCFYTGCGSGNSETAGTPPSLENQATVKSSVPVTTKSNVILPTDPKEIVGVFLDAMRSGNAEQLAALFTTAARSEIARQGISIAPPGSEKATFVIDGVVERDGNVLVSSTWTEPSAGGVPAEEMEVVWVLRKENGNWRICEMAVDAGEDQELEVVNFEKLESPEQQAVRPPQGRVASLPTAPLGSAPAGSAIGTQNSSLPQQTLPGSTIPNTTLPGGTLTGEGGGLPSSTLPSLPGTTALPPASSLPGSLPPANGLPR